MKVTKIKDSSFVESFGINMAELEVVSKHDGNFSWARVQPGEETIHHRHSEVELFFIYQGEGIVSNSVETTKVCSGDAVEFNSLESHTIKNIGDKELIFLDYYYEVNSFVSASNPEKKINDTPMFVFSTPPTPNGDLHLGHLSGPYLGADVFCRYQKMKGRKAFHLTGSDDYQSYVAALSETLDKSPEDVASHYSEEIKKTLDLMGIHLDQYIVTSTDSEYQEYITECIRRLLQSDKIEVLENTAAFDRKTQEYLYEVDISGQCPTCGEGCSGNICEECGEPNFCHDIVDATSRKSDGKILINNYQQLVLDLKQCTDAISKHHNQSKIAPRILQLSDSVLNKEKLPIPLSHPSNWGIAIPDESKLQNQVFWVWPEMAFGFLYGIKKLGVELNEDWSVPSNSWELVHFFGYDNSFYHCILYPALYSLAFPNWNPNIDYNYNEFFLLEGKKFSTSRRHAVWGKEVLGEQTVDAIRFYLCCKRPEFARENFQPAKLLEFYQSLLIDKWQRWMTNLESCLSDEFQNEVPPVGLWLPEQHAYLNLLLETQRNVSQRYNDAGFSANGAANMLINIIDDVVNFSQYGRTLYQCEKLKAYARTQMVLEITTLRVFSMICNPIMPGYSNVLARCLEVNNTHWSESVSLAEAGPIGKLPIDFFGSGFTKLQQWYGKTQEAVSE